MNKFLAIIPLSLALVSAAHAQTINNLGAGRGSVVGTDLFPSYQGANPAVRPTASQIAAYVYLLMSGDCTATGTGTITCTKTNGAAFGALARVSTSGSSLLKGNGSGGVANATAGTDFAPATSGSALLKANGAGGFSNAASGTDYAPPTSGSALLKGNGAGGFSNAASGTDYAPATSGSSLLKGNGTGGFSNAASGTDYAPATSGSSPLFGNGAGGFSNGTKSGSTTQVATVTGTLTANNCAKWDASGNIVDAGVGCGGGSGITSLTPGAGQVSSTASACSQSAITTTGTLSTAECVNAQVGTTYTIVDGDRGKLITGTNAAAQAYSLAQAGASTTFQSGWFTRVLNKGAGPLTITPTTSTICGNASLTILPGQAYKITSDGTNYQCDGGTTGSIAVSSQTGANYAFVSSDFGKLVNLSNASAQIPTIPQAGSTGFPSGWYVQVCNQGAGPQTITPATSTIGGASTFVLPGASAAAPACVAIISDGSNYQVVPDFVRNVVQTNVANTFTATQTFAGVIGTVTTQSGTTYTFAASDCGTTVRFSNASAVTATIPQGLPVGCNIAVLQAGAGQVSVNGSAVTPATLQSARSYTKTFGAGAIIGLTNDATNHVILTGDGA